MDSEIQAEHEVANRMTALYATECGEHFDTWYQDSMRRQHFIDEYKVKIRRHIKDGAKIIQDKIKDDENHMNYMAWCGDQAENERYQIWINSILAVIVLTSTITGAFLWGINS